MRKLVKVSTRSKTVRFKRLLLVKRNHLTAPRGENWPFVPPASESEGDLMDCASAALEAEVQVHLRQTDGRLLKAIDDALSRLRTKRYGVCERCGRSISRARLMALPWASQCRDCKESEELGRVASERE
jgi:RNA polymerase-binding protein DksA